MSKKHNKPIPYISIHKDKFGRNLKFGDLFVFVGYRGNIEFSPPCIYLRDTPSGGGINCFGTPIKNGLYPRGPASLFINKTEHLHQHFKESVFWSACHVVRVATVDYETKTLVWESDSIKQSIINQKIGYNGGQNDIQLLEEIIRDMEIPDTASH